MSCLYFIADQRDEATRNLTKALTIYPQLVDRPDDVIEIVGNNALSLRTGQPAEFITALFNHLPAGAEALHR